MPRSVSRTMALPITTMAAAPSRVTPGIWARAWLKVIPDPTSRPQRTLRPPMEVTKQSPIPGRPIGVVGCPPSSSMN